MSAQSNQQKPSVGRVVHYVAYGTPGGEYPSVCRAAIITEVDGPAADAQHAQPNDPTNPDVGLCVLNPTGMFFNQHVPYGETGGHWHWPERV